MKKQLKDVCEGFTKNIAQKDLSENNGKYPIFGASGIIKTIDFYISDKPYIGIVKDGSGVGRTNKYPAKSSLLGTMQYILPNQGIDLDYLMYGIRSLHLGENYSGAAIPHIYFKVYKNRTLDFPELAEQKQRSIVLNKIQDAINVKEKQLFELENIIQSEFVEMFGEGSCKQIPFSEYAEIIDGDRGKNYPKSEDFSDDDYCLFLSAKNVTKNGFLFENNQFISKEKDEILRKGKLNRGDIVITTRGTIGNIAYFDDSIPYENIRINSGMVIIRNKDLEFNQRFFLEAFRNKIDEIIATQVTGAAQPQLPIHIMSKITLPYPDLPLQNQFAAFVQKIDKSKFVVKQQIAHLAGTLGQ